MNERIRTDMLYNLPHVDLERCVGTYQMPLLKPEHYIPDSMIGFNYAMSARKKAGCIHFYLDDYQFERVWQQPEKYIDILRKFDCVLTPDFSLYRDMPIANMIWNVYRSRLIGQMMQDAGLKVIPTVSWGGPKTFDFCFDGLPEDSVLSVSTIGAKRGAALVYWVNGMSELLRRKNPKTLLIYGGKIEYDYGNTKVEYFENAITGRLERNMYVREK